MVLLGFSWLYMQWTHEAGHIIAGVLSGAHIDRVVLDPRIFSRTDLSGNTHPLITCWCGPLLGIVLGAGVCLLFAACAASWRFTLLMVAAFVFLANGLYIGLGALTPVGDAMTMLKLGTPPGIMIVFGLLCAVTGRKLVFVALSTKIERPTSRQTLVVSIAALVLVVIGWIAFPN